MIKLRYDATTGLIGSAYPSEYKVVEPYIEISEKENDEIKHRDKTYVIDGKLVDITGTAQDLALKAVAIKQELPQKLYALKANVAYGGIVVNNDYIFETNATSIVMVTSKYVELLNDKTQKEVANWKCYNLAGEVKFITFTREQFIALQNFANKMIGTDCFGIENKYTQLVLNATDKELNDTKFTNDLIEKATAEFAEVERTIEFEELTVA